MLHREVTQTRVHSVDFILYHLYPQAKALHKAEARARRATNQKRYPGKFLDKKGTQEMLGQGMSIALDVGAQVNDYQGMIDTDGQDSDQSNSEAGAIEMSPVEDLRLAIEPAEEEAGPGDQGPEQNDPSNIATDIYL